MSFAPIVLFMLATAVLPSSVLQSRFKLSSLHLIIGVLGISALTDMRLFVILQLPELPSLNDNDTGTKASFVIEAHPVSVKKSIVLAMREVFFIRLS